MYSQYCVQLNEVFHSKMLIHLQVLVIELEHDEDVRMLRRYYHQISHLFNENRLMKNLKKNDVFNILPSDRILRLFFNQTNPFQDIGNIIDPAFLFCGKTIGNLLL